MEYETAASTNNMLAVQILFGLAIASFFALVVLGENKALPALYQQNR